jgi:hypothetical protein
MRRGVSRLQPLLLGQWTEVLKQDVMREEDI